MTKDFKLWACSRYKSQSIELQRAWEVWQAAHTHGVEQGRSENYEMTAGVVRAVNEACRKRDEWWREQLHDIVMWCKAYPLTVFPEPDMEKAHKLLKAGGMTLDAISASNMRHVLTGLQRIANEALRDLTDEGEASDE